MVASGDAVSLDMLRDFDILNQGHRHCLIALRVRKVRFWWIALPCSSFSRARKFDGVGPSSLRDFYPMGLLGLSEADKKKVEEGNELMKAVCNLCHIAQAHHVPWCADNPASSFL